MAAFSDGIRNPIRQIACLLSWEVCGWVLLELKGSLYVIRPDGERLQVLKLTVLICDTMQHVFREMVIESKYHRLRLQDVWGQC